MRKNKRKHQHFLHGLATVLLFLAILSLSLPAHSQMRNLTSYVDPFIGTDGGGNVFPGAALPFGMVKLGPDCGDKNSPSGYQSEGKIWGFSHTHLSGTQSAAKYGNVLLIPITGKLDIKNYGSERQNEEATPGYYAVTLSRYDIRAELTAAHKAGLHQYTFPQAESAHILLDAGSFLGENYAQGQEFIGSEIEIISDTQIEGYTRLRGKGDLCDAYTVYFCAIFDTPAKTTGTWKGDEISHNSKSQIDTGEKTGAFFTYKTTQKQIISIKVGISFISPGKARLNALGELSGWNFEGTQISAQNRWNEELNSITVDGGSEIEKRIFYTALYHSLLMPSNRTGENPNWNHSKVYYDDFCSLWHTYRTQHPLFNLVFPEREKEMLNSLLDIYKHEGYLPNSRSGNSSGKNSGGSSADILFADAFVKNIAGVNYEKAYQAVKTNAEEPPGALAKKHGRGALPEYKTAGYVPAPYPHAASQTVEYAYCDFALAQLARGLNKTQEAEKYLKRSENWQNLWKTLQAEGFKGFIVPKNAEGKWVKNFDPNRAEDYFLSGNSWIYSFFAPHDVKKLIEKSGGAEEFAARLDFILQEKIFSFENQSAYLIPSLYNYAGKPHKTAGQVKQILNKKFQPQRDGLPANDAAGALSAWYVFHAIGFYPNAGQDLYLISSPLFETSKIKLGNETIFEVQAKNLSTENIYVQSATLNGKKLDRSWFRHTEIENGGTLVLEMGSTPSGWGSQNLPPSLSDK